MYYATLFPLTLGIISTLNVNPQLSNLVTFFNNT